MSSEAKAQLPGREKERKELPNEPVKGPAPKVKL